MITIKGRPIHPGIAIAVAAVVDFSNGPSSLPYSILERAMKAVKRQSIPEDQPEVVLVSEQLFFAASLNIPGLQKAAVVCESPDEVQGMPMNVPCIIDAQGAVGKITSETIVIVDANRGMVLIDPDVHTFISYQQELEEIKTRKRPRVFLESTHIPAKTQSGQSITVAARVRNLAELKTAVDQGADSVTAEFDLADPNAEDIVNSLMGTVGGKPVTFIVNGLVSPFVSFVLSLSVPDQVTFAFPAAEVLSEKQRITEMMEMMDSSIIDLPHPHFAAIAKSSDDSYTGMSAGVGVLLEREPDELEGAIRNWLSAKKAKALTVVLGRNSNVIPTAVRAGASAMEVEPDLVQEAKEMIRLLP